MKDNNTSKFATIDKMNPEDIEGKYLKYIAYYVSKYIIGKLHNLDKMESFTVMQKEVELMEMKVGLMKKKGENSEYYEQKKEILENRIVVCD